MFERGRSVARDDASFVDDRDAMRQEFNLREGMRREQQGGAAVAQNFSFQEVPEFHGGDGVQAAGGFIQEEDARLVKQSTSQAETLHGSRRQCAQLTIKGIGEFKLFAQCGDAFLDAIFRQAIQAAEEAKVLAAGKSRIKPVIGSRVITEIAADLARLLDGIASGNPGYTTGWHDERSQNSKERRFARAIRSQQSERLAFAHLKRNMIQRESSWLLKRLQQRVPSAPRGWKQFLQAVDGDCGLGHKQIYSLSVFGRQTIGGRIDGGRRVQTPPRCISSSRTCGVQCWYPNTCSGGAKVAMVDSSTGAAARISFSLRVSVPQNVLVRFLDRESVFLNLQTERYFGLDETGTRMWQLVTASPTIETAYQELLAEFDVEPESLRVDLTELLRRLVDNGLLDITPSDVGTPQAI